MNAPVSATAVLMIALALAPALPGCRRAADPAPPSGSYRLVSVDRRELPATVHHGQATLEIRQGTFVFDPDGSCHSRIRFVTPDGREQVRETAATYTQAGADVSMRWKGAGRTQGRREGDTFTMTNEGMLFIYRAEVLSP